MEKKKEKSFYCHMVREESVRNRVRKSRVPEKANLGAGQHPKETGDRGGRGGEGVRKAGDQQTLMVLCRGWV